VSVGLRSWGTLPSSASKAGKRDLSTGSIGSLSFAVTWASISLLGACGAGKTT